MNEKAEIKAKLESEGFHVVNVVSAWSNGNKIRRYSGQDSKSVWHNPKDGYRKMYAVLIEVEEASE
jgi:hypothetical protein